MNKSNEEQNPGPGADQKAHDTSNDISANLSAVMPRFEGEIDTFRWWEKPLRWYPLKWFISACIARDISRDQVVKAISEKKLRIHSSEDTAIAPPSPDLINALLEDVASVEKFLVARAYVEPFFEKTLPDHQGGWGTTYETSDSGLPIKILLKLQDDLSQAIKERDQYRLELDEARKKLKSRPPDVQRWKDSVSAIVGGFMQNVLTQAERQSIITRLQGKKRANIAKMCADSQVLGDAEDAFWRGLWVNVPEHLRPGPGRKPKS